MQSSSGEFVPAAGTGSTSTCTSGSGLSVKWSNTMLAAVFFVGTGGFATAQALNYVPGAPGVVRIAHQPGQAAMTPQHVIDTQEKLAGIRRYLSLNVSNMAKTLRVGRPTVYSWLRDDPSLHANHARRIDEVYGLARAWRTISNEPLGDFLVRPLTSGGTILQLLSDKTLDEPAIQNAFLQIADAVNRKARRASVVEIAKQRGFRLAPSQPITSWASSDEVDV
jgi:hypothetical protein